MRKTFTIPKVALSFLLGVAAFGTVPIQAAEIGYNLTQSQGTYSLGATGDISTKGNYYLYTPESSGSYVLQTDYTNSSMDAIGYKNPWNPAATPSTYFFFSQMAGDESVYIQYNAVSADLVSGEGWKFVFDLIGGTTYAIGYPSQDTEMTAGFTFTMNINESGPASQGLSSVDPEPGESAFDYNYSPEIQIRATAGITAYDAATFSYGNVEDDITNEGLISLNGYPAFIQVGGNSTTFKNYVDAAAQSGETSFTITITGVTAGGVLLSANEYSDSNSNISVEDGTVTLTYAMDSAPALVSQTWPSTFYADWSSVSDSKATLTFNKNIASVEEVTVYVYNLVPGQETGESVVVPTYILNKEQQVSIDGTTVTIDFANYSENYIGTASVVSIWVNGVKGENGMNVNFGDYGDILVKNISYVNNSAGTDPEEPSDQWQTINWNDPFSASSANPYWSLTDSTFGGALYITSNSSTNLLEAGYGLIYLSEELDNPYDEINAVVDSEGNYVYTIEWLSLMAGPAYFYYNGEEAVSFTFVQGEYKADGGDEEKIYTFGDTATFDGFDNATVKFQSNAGDTTTMSAVSNSSEDLSSFIKLILPSVLEGFDDIEYVPNSVIKTANGNLAYYFETVGTSVMTFQCYSFDGAVEITFQEGKVDGEEIGGLTEGGEITLGEEFTASPDAQVWTFYAEGEKEFDATLVTSSSTDLVAAGLLEFQTYGTNVLGDWNAEETESGYVYSGIIQEGAEYTLIYTGEEEVTFTLNETPGVTYLGEAQNLTPELNSSDIFFTLQLTWDDELIAFVRENATVEVSKDGEYAGTINASMMQMQNSGDGSEPGIDTLAEAGDEGNILNILFSDYVSGEGTYSFSIPSGIVMSVESGAINPEQTVYVVLNGLVQGTVTPESGAEFTEGENVVFTVSFENGTVEQNYAPDGVLLLTSYSDDQAQDVRYSWDDSNVVYIENNVVNINLGNDWKVGTYGLSVLESVVVVDGVGNEGMEIMFSVVEGEGITVPENLYMIGDGIGWTPGSPLEATTAEDGVFTFEGVTLNSTAIESAYFSFINTVNEDWDVINDGEHRYGPAAGTDAALVAPVTTEFAIGGDTSWYIANGAYNFTMDFNNMTLTVSEYEGGSDAEYMNPTFNPEDNSTISYGSVSLEWAEGVYYIENPVAYVSFDGGEEQSVEISIFGGENQYDPETGETTYTPGPAYEAIIDFSNLTYNDDFTAKTGQYVVRIPAGTFMSFDNQTSKSPEYTLTYFLVGYYNKYVAIPTPGDSHVYAADALEAVTVSWENYASFSSVNPDNQSIQLNLITSTAGEGQSTTSLGAIPSDKVTVNSNNGTIVLDLSYLEAGNYQVVIPSGYVYFNAYTMCGNVELNYVITDGLSTATVLQPTESIISIPEPVNLTWNYKEVYPTETAMTATLAYFDAAGDAQTATVSSDLFSFYTIEEPGDDNGDTDNTPDSTPVPAAETASGNVLSIDVVDLLEGAQGYVTLSIPAGIVATADGKANPAQEVTFRILPIYEEAYNIAYADNMLTITWEDDTEVGFAGEGVALIEGENNNILLEQGSDISISADYNSVVVDLSVVTADGNYTLVIPEGYLMLDYGYINGTMSYEFNITDGEFGEGHIYNNGGGDNNPGGDNGDDNNPGGDNGDDNGGEGEDGPTSAISALEAEANQSGVYNLNGMKVGNSLNGLVKGIYVVNGQKVIIK